MTPTRSPSISRPRFRRRSPWRSSPRQSAGRSMVNAWWGTFDLAVGFFSGRPADPPSDDFIMRNGGDAQQVGIGWWPGNPKRNRRSYLRARVSGT